MEKRDFLISVALGFGASLLSGPLRAFGTKETLRTAHVGVGNMGFEDLKAIAAHPNVVVTALCDVDSNYLKKAKALFPKAKIFKDYRQMFGAISNEIDAVIVSTPDHTHAPVSLLAMENNKAVYCQKPLTHYVSESRVTTTGEAKRLNYPNGHTGTFLLRLSIGNPYDSKRSHRKSA